MRDVKQKYKGVSPRQWKKWNAKERDTYNLIMHSAVRYQSIINPATLEDSKDKMPHQQWRTIVHNIAFLAADNLRLARKHRENPEKY